MRHHEQSKEVRVTVDSNGVAYLKLSRPQKSNAFIDSMWEDLQKALWWLDEQEDIRAIILCGDGKNFCAGIDLSSLENIMESTHLPDPARVSSAFRSKILKMQESINTLEAIKWPVIAAIHGACIGGGLDIIAACNIRICSADAKFSLKEVDIAITADLGSLQRLPTIIGHGATMELALTARKFSAGEAKAMGLVSEVATDKEALDKRVKELAKEIASKSPMAVIGTKRVLLQARDCSVLEGLEYVATWNSSQALSHDLREVMKVIKKKDQLPAFSRL